MCDICANFSINIILNTPENNLSTVKKLGMKYLHKNYTLPSLSLEDFLSAYLHLCAELLCSFLPFRSQLQHSEQTQKTALINKEKKKKKKRKNSHVFDTTLLWSSTRSSTISSVLRERLKTCSSSMSSAGRLPEGKKEKTNNLGQIWYGLQF